MALNSFQQIPGFAPVLGAEWKQECSFGTVPQVECGIIAAWKREEPELCFHTDVDLNHSFSIATCLTLCMFLNLEKLQFLHL